MELELRNHIATFMSEFIASALLLYLGCMGCISNVVFANSHFQMCINFGLVVMILVVIFHCPSGPHMNPALTLAAVLFYRITPHRGAIYLAGQILGAPAGYGLLILSVPHKLIHPPLAAHGLCVTHINSQFNLGQAVLIEFILTTVLCWICCAIWDPRNAKFGDGVAIKFGLAVASLAITGGSFTGASMNPTRSLGPALWHMDFQDQWVYWVGPLLAGAFAPLFYNLVFWRNENGTLERERKDE